MKASDIKIGKWYSTHGEAMLVESLTDTDAIGHQLDGEGGSLPAKVPLDQVKGKTVVWIVTYTVQPVYVEAQDRDEAIDIASGTYRDIDFDECEEVDEVD